jgi:hypothetical protein
MTAARVSWRRVCIRRRISKELDLLLGTYRRPTIDELVPNVVSREDDNQSGEVDE